TVRGAGRAGPPPRGGPGAPRLRLRAEPAPRRLRLRAEPASVGAPSLRAEPTSRASASVPSPRPVPAVPRPRCPARGGVRAGQRLGRSGGEGLCLLGPLEPPLELGTLDVDVRQRPVQPAGQPPGLLPEQAEH